MPKNIACRDKVEEEENFFLIPIKKVTATCRLDDNHETNVLNTSYDNLWICVKKGTILLLEPNYDAPYLKGRGINQIHISFDPGVNTEYYFTIQESNDNEKFTNITSTLRSATKTDALQPFYLPEEIKPKYLRIVFNGNNFDNYTRVYTVQLVNAEVQPYGKSYVPFSA